MEYYAIGLFIWLILFVAGTQQFKRLRQKTIDLALSEIKNATKQNRGITVEQYYEKLLPRWEEMVSKSAWFIPHKTELWPMPASPAYVRKRMNFSQVWLGAFLRLNGFKLNCAAELEDKIMEVVNSVPERQKSKY